MTFAEQLKSLTMSATTYYGFSNASQAEEPAWFHSPEAAQRFADACGWENAEIETTTDVDTSDVMDTPEQPWSK